MSYEAHTLCFLSNTNFFQSFLWIKTCLCKRIFWTVIEKFPPAGFSLYKFIGFGGWIAGQARPFDVHHFYKDIKCTLQLPSRKCSLFPQKTFCQINRVVASSPLLGRCLPTSGAVSSQNLQCAEFWSAMCNLWCSTVRLCRRSFATLKGRGEHSAGPCMGHLQPQGGQPGGKILD